MGLEVATYLNQLVASNPVGSTDPKSQGDDHLRLIKAVLQNTFPGLAGGAFRIQPRVSSSAVVGTDNMSVLLCTATLNLTLNTAAVLGNCFIAVVIAKSAGVTLLPSGGNTINGAASFALTNGQAAMIFSDGVSEFQAMLLGGIGGAAQTGDVKSTISATAPPGWIKAFGTIGDATSGASNRANADCEALFTLLWQLPDAQAAVPGGRGLSASADWAAHKRITVPDLRGRTLVGETDMGGTDAGNLTGGAVLGATLGVQVNSATVSVTGQTALGDKLDVNTVSTSMDGDFSHVTFAGGGGGMASTYGHSHDNVISSGETSGRLDLAATGNTASFSIVQPSFVVTMLVKL